MIGNIIHYITQDIENLSHEHLIEEACAAGVRTVQVRIKEKPDFEIRRVAHLAKQICSHYKAALIINDYVHIAKDVDADGVHLGNGDMDHNEARAILGHEKIIGGTAYDVPEAERLLKNNVVNYIGIGTFRPTATKPEISKFLTSEDIKNIVQIRNSLKRKIQVILIGGIRIGDISTILEWGLDGIAVASLINHASNKHEVVSTIYALVEKHRAINRNNA